MLYTGFFAHENNNIPVLNVYVVEVMLKVLQKAFVKTLRRKKWAMLNVIGMFCMCLKRSVLNCLWQGSDK